MKRALELHATALIMAAEVKAAAASLGIALHDHLILGNGRWTSFRREGLL